MQVLRKYGEVVCFLFDKGMGSWGIWVWFVHGRGVAGFTDGLIDSMLNRRFELIGG